MKRVYSLVLMSLIILCSGSVNASGFAAPVSGNQNTYNLGKKVFHKKLACDTCPLAGKQLNKKSAKNITEQLKKKEALSKNLKSKERKAVIHYLKEQYKI